ncbi:MAG: GTP-binding protein, partial [Bacteroidota bacterium]
MASSQKEYPADKIRNIALIGHGGSGKTTFTESLMFTAGASTRMGRVEDGSTVSDYHPDEVERKISINTALLFADWQGTKLNILDTPGYSDFTGEVLGALRVADTAVVFLKAVEGIEVGTEIVWGYAKLASLPAVIVVNKLDNENADFDSVLESAKERFGQDVTVVQFPANQGLAFDSFVDVLKMKMYTYERDGNGKMKELDIPDELKDRAAHFHEELVEKIAETDEALMNKFFEEGTLHESELKAGMQKALLARAIHPVLVSSASLNIGLAPFMDFIASYAPSPVERGSVTAQNLNTKKEMQVEPNAAGHPAMFVFKTVSEQHVGELSFFRVYSGTISGGMDLTNESNGKAERLGQVFLMKGKERKEVAKLLAGDIGSVVKLRDTHTNNTLSSKALAVVFPPIGFPDPVIRMAIQSRSKGDEDRIATGLHAL